jgi:hypothetical protein
MMIVKHISLNAYKTRSNIQGNMYVHVFKNVTNYTIKTLMIWGTSHLLYCFDWLSCKSKQSRRSLDITSSLSQSREMARYHNFSSGNWKKKHSWRVKQMEKKVHKPRYSILHDIKVLSLLGLNDPCFNNTFHRLCFCNPERVVEMSLSSFFMWKVW